MPAYSCVQALRMQYSSFEQVYRKSFLHRCGLTNISPNEQHTILYHY